MRGAERDHDDGDHQVDGYHDVYVAHNVRLVRLAYLLGASRVDAEDCAASAFVKTYPRWSAGEVEDVGSYLSAVVANSMRDRFRRRRFEFGPIDGIEIALEPADGQVTKRNAVMHALEQLRPRQREVIVLRYFEDLSEERMAELLSIPPGTVKSRLSRGLAQLRTLLEDNDD